MKIQPKKITLLGNGGWGTALALHLDQLGHQVTLWGAFAEYVEVMAQKRENIKYLPSVKIPQTIQLSSDAHQALKDAEWIILSTPSQFLRSVLKGIDLPDAKKKLCLSVTKGIEKGSLMRMSEVIQEEWGDVPLAVLSGPSIALEIAQGKPASVVVASKKRAVAEAFQLGMNGNQLRIYTSLDVIGVELGGSLKNPLAIGAGVCDGLGLGSNAKAALMTRGIVEMGRLGKALGGKEQTFHGLSGWGDLLTTCIGGRNRWLGEQLGKGNSLESVLSGSDMVFEGVETAYSSKALGRKLGVDLPIISEVCHILSGKKSPKAAVEALMKRAARPERDV